MAIHPQRIDMGLRMANVIIQDLPRPISRKVVPYTLWLADDDYVELKIMPRNRWEFWKVAKLLDIAPRTIEQECKKGFTGLKVTSIMDPCFFEPKENTP